MPPPTCLTVVGSNLLLREVIHHHPAFTSIIRLTFVTPCASFIVEVFLSSTCTWTSYYLLMLHSRIQNLPGIITLSCHTRTLCHFDVVALFCRRVLFFLQMQLMKTPCFLLNMKICFIEVRGVVCVPVQSIFVWRGINVKSHAYQVLFFL